MTDPAAPAAKSAPPAVTRPAAPRPTLRSRVRVLLAVARKEWLIFRRYPSWVVAFFVWPLLFPLAYIYTARALGGPDGASLGTFAGVAGTTDYVSFIVLGATVYMWLNITLWDVGTHLRNEQTRGTLESNWVCPVGRLSLLVGASLTKLATATLFLVVTVLEFWLLFGVRLLRGNVPLLLLVLLLTIPVIYGIGLLFASLVVRFKEANAMVFLVRGVFMVFCGVTVPLAVLPEWMQRVAVFLPLTYTIQDARAAALADAGVGALAPDLLRLGAFAVALPLVGALAFRLVEAGARRTGTLGHY